MKKLIAAAIALIWCIGLSWVTHEIYLDLLATTSFVTAWAISSLMSVMNLATSFLLYAFIALSRDF